MQFALTIAYAFALLIVQSTAAHVMPWDLYVPNAALALVLYMGLHDHDLGRGTLLSFGIGYLMDSFAGSPMGLFTFVAVAVFFISKFAAVRLFLQGWIFEMILVFLLSLVGGGIVLAIRALFDQDFGSLLTHAKIVGWRSGATALIAPLVFAGMRRIERYTSGKKRRSTTL